MIYKIMVVDDDKNIVYMISQFMKIYNIEVVPVFNGKDAIKLLDESIQLVILDINMRTLNGIEVCKTIRMNYNIPILFLSGNSAQHDKVLGLGVGADDYITKPFDPLELAARVKAHIRRWQEYNVNINNSKNKMITFDEFSINRNTHKVMKNGEELSLSSTEFKLLLYFIDNTNTVLTRKKILSEVWESNHYDENTVTTYVKRLRQKLKIDENEQRYIKSVRGVGYVFEMEL
ncbi:response regulator transcription factor [Alkaliphilus peptidifermentans]|uniref:Stage 0 sporulation protein A homolog n=1 Tax=Alkaliphilus peptidifermentans DSM 18978 TaxID=1120976 RepID=A0A1G5HC96_9FIRM|nr:response regulator transcription factor [Alkaliphilus peptidifermentans]SCY61337.1 DNA-binding response regulator, OmpR family, contains REC and winged-helix (wHTH) domain [Alkaliphilus peptidifermentans DSM 18978]